MRSEEEIRSLLQDLKIEYELDGVDKTQTFVMVGLLIWVLGD